MTCAAATIDSAALRHNLSAVRRRAPNSRVLAIVKADAYGHGIVATAKALAGADAFGVARLSEALALRSAGFEQPLVLLEGVFSVEQLELAAQQRFECVVHCFEQVELLEQRAQDHRFDLWLKVDTGMNRLGFRPEDFATALSRLLRCGAGRSVRVMTHLAAAEEPGGMMARRQIERFETLVAAHRLERSIANSAGVICHPESHVEWVRPGIMLYGISPLENRSAAELGLRPAMTLSAPLIAIRKVTSGESVGYGASWIAARDSRIGIVAIGYGDGYPRGIRNGTPVLVRNSEVGTAGRVSMDMTAIDLTDLPDVQVGDTATLWGEGLPIERVASCAKTIGYELVCRVKGRVAVKWV